MKKFLPVLPLVAALALTGCVNLAPDYERPAAPVAEQWPMGESYQAGEIKRQALPKWEEFVLDERLKQVIRLALENNRDLRITALNVEVARAAYGVQRADLMPTVAAAAQNAVSHYESTSRTSHAYSASLAMSSYEIDFFGRVRNLTEQALQAYLQSEDAQRTAQGSLIAEVINAWLTLGADRAQLELQKETLASQEESFRLVEESYKYGAASQLELEQSRQTTAAARAAIASYIRAVAQDQNALELLAGTKIDESLLPTTLTLSATLPAYLPEGLPSEVLLNRPDIMSAERGMIAANAYIGVARAAFFPSISLTGSLGSQSTSLSDLFGNGSGFWAFTPSVSLPLFTGGANLANLQSAAAQERIAAATYEQTIQSAFREVADALATEGTIERELKARTEYADAASKAFELSSSRYKHGAAAYTEVLDAQRTKVSAQQALITTQLSRAASFVTLYKVLGGGTEVANPGADVPKVGVFK
ncbi:efflux transporter outer membrane subunit [Sutterella sp.]|uniref:efflux transporter outer membrane subunit n=1 Tax=Sutterella sp. TaxID=1981025 RepID=UPI0026E0161A|nr:efflux transporter outer membrane subunit [Sutterella sp.]MDO5530467.1 efflux transporter outer membrane subunit [Sutterella sp.]